MANVRLVTFTDYPFLLSQGHCNGKSRFSKKRLKETPMILDPYSRAIRDITEIVPIRSLKYGEHA